MEHLHQNLDDHHLISIARLDEFLPESVVPAAVDGERHARVTLDCRSHASVTLGAAPRNDYPLATFQRRGGAP
jgi:hypothetical protein